MNYMMWIIRFSRTTLGLIAIAILLSSSRPMFAATDVNAGDWPPPAWQPDSDENTRVDLQNMLLYLAVTAEKQDGMALLAAHFRSVALVVDACGAKAPQVVKKLRESYLADWGAGPLDWQSYLQGRPLMLAWRSPYDGVVSVTLVVLPKGWDPDKHWPLYFELHGGGRRTVGRLAETSMEFVNRDKGVGLASFRRDGLHVYPFNRGLTGYVGVGEIDLWECLAVVDRHFLTDPRRQYVYGFSLGGGGAFSFAASSMAKRGWAGVACYSPTPGHNEWMAGVLSNTPVWLCFGDKEWESRVRMLERSEQKSMRDMLREAGNEPEFTLVPNTGHRYLGDYQVKMLDFLAAHINESPALPLWQRMRVYAQGDDSLELYVNETPVSIGPADQAGTARIKIGRNVVAAHVENINWTGGLMFAADVAGAEPIVSDATWKCTWRKPEGDWTSEDYDDSDWAPADDMCEVASWMGYAKHADRLEPFATRRSHLIGPPPVQHYRKTFRSAGGEAEVSLQGNGFQHRVWVNGRLAGQGKENAEQADEEKTAWNTLTYECKTVEGENVVAIELTSQQLHGAGVMLRAAVFHPAEGGGTARVRTGPGWRVSPMAEPGWTGTGFDDSGWTLTDHTFINRARRSDSSSEGISLVSPFCLSPGDLYFRKTFTVTPAEDQQ